MHYLRQLFLPGTLIETRKCQFTNEEPDCFTARQIKVQSGVISFRANYPGTEINKPAVKDWKNNWWQIFILKKWEEVVDPIGAKGDFSYR